MSRDYEPISSTQGKKSGIRNIIILLLVAFIGGVIATGWAVSKFDLFSDDAATTQEIAAENSESAAPAAAALEERIQPDGTVSPPEPEDTPPISIEPDQERALARRVADLEDRLSRINVQAQAAGGNAARAEGLLIAFAARRALDRGSSLGYIEEQLKLRFGAAQPVAVTTIINAAKSPVTLDELRIKLDETAPSLTSASSDAGLWEGFQKEVSELFVVRREGTPSTAPDQRLARAQRYLETDRVEAALEEVKRMPGNAGEWTTLAKRYIDARTALDLIETAAILEPRALRTSEGTKVRQPSPLTPEGALPPQ
ncbi:hypothetical protein [Sphingorhabdus sp. Alg239-R122]|uniref:hypothetical protein n=1 Tax=Sphingorhabdus sp. Alg239-R122 TaxID=2305989 RepID=UPI0013D98464|nr:hypothetical protein [Sphingorhabdus sp. Alg239-R122]